eukprot:3637857-Rhodomonas_salina.5
MALNFTTPSRRNAESVQKAGTATKNPGTKGEYRSQKWFCNNRAEMSFARFEKAAVLYHGIPALQRN